MSSINNYLRNNTALTREMFSSGFRPRLKMQVLKISNIVITDGGWYFIKKFSFSRIRATSHKVKLTSAAVYPSPFILWRTRRLFLLSTKVNAREPLHNLHLVYRHSPLQTFYALIF